MNSEILKLNKCPECGLLVPVGTEHVCEGRAGVPESDANHRRRDLIVAGLALLVMLVFIGSQAVTTFREQRSLVIENVATRTYPFSALDYDRVAIGMKYSDVANTLGQEGEVESTYTDSYGTRMDIKWSRGGSYIRVTLFNGAVTDKYAKGLAFR